jgi:tRNA(Ile2)-agmatinylcytidine synthase
VIQAAHGLGFDLIGDPRLVRLNPNVPWKTRGNAALAARFGIGHGPRRRVGQVGTDPVWSFAKGREVPTAAVDQFIECTWAAVGRCIQRDDPRTEPAMVIARRTLAPELYWEAVSGVVERGRVVRILDRAGARWLGEGVPRGVIGASAVLAWPAHRSTFELIAYRERARIGTPRDVDAESVRRTADRFPELFSCYDDRTRRLLVTPHTDCPILYGLRATRADRLARAHRSVVSEPVDRWLIFRTNQGTGDHLRARRIHEIGPYDAASIEGEVGRIPSVGPGGHVRFELADLRRDRIECVVFEPSKTLTPVARSLRPGDRLRVWGGRGEDPSFRVEGLELIELTRRVEGRTEVRCPECSRRVRSLGLGRGFRCRPCHRRFPPELSMPVLVPPPYPRGTYHPTLSARRHLAPLANDRLKVMT